MAIPTSVYVLDKGGSKITESGLLISSDTIATLLNDSNLIAAGITEVSATIGGEALSHDSKINDVLSLHPDYSETFVCYQYIEKTYPETIAGQIERLQDAKADIKTAIEGKGVTIGSSDTIDCYAGYIDNIPTGISGVSGIIDLLVVGGGGNGGSPSGYGGTGGGGGGGVVYKESMALSNTSYNVVVGSRNNNSCFGTIVAYAGGNGGGGYMSAGGAGGSGGGSSGICNSNYNYCGGGGVSCPGQGKNGGYGYNSASGGTAINGAIGGGGGGYSSAGLASHKGATGGNGFQSDISGQCCWYAGGGGGGGYLRGYNGGCGGCGGGGNGSSCSTDWCGRDATYYGGGGGGTGYSGCKIGCGCQGIVILRYLTNGNCGIHSATGGTKYTCGDYTIHCFTSNGTFCIIC